MALTSRLAHSVATTVLLTQAAHALRLHEQKVRPWGNEIISAVDAQADLLVRETPRVPLRKRDASISLRRDNPVHVGITPVTRRPHYRTFIIKATVILGVALVLLLLYQQLYEGIERRTGIGIKHVSCFIFVVLSVSVDISTKHAAKSQGGHYKFDPAIAVVVVELCKLVISSFLFMVSVASTKNKSQIVLPNINDVMILIIPGVVYTCNNILVFEAIEQVPMATFAVIRETRLIWNALIWMAIFKVPLGLTRWIAIIGVIIGCTANQVPAAIHSTFTWGVCYALLLAFLNASGGVTCEFAMKNKSAMDINLQNSIIYLACASLALLYVAVFRPGDYSSPAAFFKGFQPECLQVIVLQVITGLTVSRILKHVESVTKSMVAAFCGPIICFVGSAMLQAHLHWHEILSSLVVVVSCLIFLRQGPLSTTGTAKAKTVT